MIFSIRTLFCCWDLLPQQNSSCLCVFFFFCPVNSYGHGGTGSSPNHTFSWASLNKPLTSTLCTYLTTTLLEWFSEIISWSISTKVWDRAGIKLATPGSAVRLASVAKHVTDCATRPRHLRVNAELYLCSQNWLHRPGMPKMKWKKLTENDCCATHGRERNILRDRYLYMQLIIASFLKAGWSAAHYLYRGQKYFNIALVLQDKWLTIFTCPANTLSYCTNCPLKAMQ